MINVRIPASSRYDQIHRKILALQTLEFTWLIPDITTLDAVSLKTRRLRGAVFHKRDQSWVGQVLVVVTRLKLDYTSSHSLVYITQAPGHTMTIYADIARELADGQPHSPAEILPHLSALSSLPEGEAALRLLIRLGRQFKPLPDDRWVLAADAQTPEQRIVAATRAYFQSHPEGFALINTLAKGVAVDTGYPLSQVKSIILARFKNNAGQMIVNQLKENS